MAQENHRYRRKPLEVEAYQFFITAAPGAWPEWLREAFATPSGSKGSFYKDRNELFHVVNRRVFAETVIDGDWIVRHPDGELSRVKAPRFHATYEKVVA